MEIRNFCILAHIDHGKSTLADRMLEITGSVPMRKMREQFLDAHPLERERGITIKMAPVRMRYQGYILNLIDTPGHVDFSYEVSRALAAVEGAILLVDATQGIQAQTIANLRLAQEEKLIIIPVINKIDLASADVAKTENELQEFLGVDPEDILKISARTGQGVEDVLRAVIAVVPPPSQTSSDEAVETPLQALVFDSKYESYLGVVAHVRIRQGSIAKGDPLRFIATGAQAVAAEVGVFLPDRAPTERLSAGEIGYVATGVKEPESVRVGDTLTKNFDLLSVMSARAGQAGSAYRALSPLPGYREPAPMVWASIFPRNQDEYEQLRDGLRKLQLEDAALTFTPEAAGVLGRGFRAGFLGMLHMEIVAERIRREYALDVVFSRPSVSFRVVSRTSSGGGRSEEKIVYAAHALPDAHLIERIEEPWVTLDILTPAEYLGALTMLIHERGGRIMATVGRGHDRIEISSEAPLREIVLDFYDRLKSATHGYGSMAYASAGWRAADLVRLEILVAGETMPALSEIVPRSGAHASARARVEKLKSILPARLFTISLQGAVEGKIIARETIPALKKDVTGYLYGGDRTRKMKLWKKQQKGKKRLAAGAHVDIPPDVFFKILSR